MANKFTFTDAAEKVLEQFSEKQPMHYKEITEKAIELELISTNGLTPEATMASVLLREIDRFEKQGRLCRFIFEGKGFFSLSQWLEKGISSNIDKHNHNVRDALLKKLKQLDSHEFEKLIAQLLPALGFEGSEVTKRSGDGGIDVIGELIVGEVIRSRLAVQVKRWKQKVNPDVVQRLRGSLSPDMKGLIITTSDFTKGAKEEAIRLDAIPIALMNGEQLVRLLIENDMGVSRQHYDLLEIDEEFFSETDVKAEFILP